MKAMIFAAGLGTRLRPYTEQKPKALVPVDGVPMLGRLVEKLKTEGFNELIINVHHFADQVAEYLSQNRNFGIRIEISDETGELLDTGGGLKKAAWFFDDGLPFLLHNVDVMSNIDLAAMVNHHLMDRPLATLAVSRRSSSRYFLFDTNLQLCGWENKLTGERKLSKEPGTDLVSLAFSGIHIIDPEIFSVISETGKFSLVDVYIRLAGENRIQGMIHSAAHWIDMGKAEDLERAGKMLKMSG